MGSSEVAPAIKWRGFFFFLYSYSGRPTFVATEGRATVRMEPEIDTHKKFGT